MFFYMFMFNMFPDLNLYLFWFLILFLFLELLKINVFKLFFSKSDVDVAFLKCQIFFLKLISHISI